jgi:arylsulfatase A-like enzyme
LPKPNLLFLYTDEQRYDTLAAAGNTRIEMPNLNRLAAQSTVFERTYVSQPVCTPSRCTLLTGLTPHTSGMTHNNLILRGDVPCLPEMLADADYLCAHHGKWHLGDEIFAQHGFREWVATEDTYHNWYLPHRDQAERSAYHHFLVANGVTPEPHPELPPDIASRFFRGQIHQLPEPLSRPAFLGNEASRFIRDSRGRPWALYVNFLEPHMPFHSCRDTQYDPADVTLPSNFDDRLTGGQSLRYRISAAHAAAKGFEGQPLSDEPGWRELIARYWGMCSLVDTHVGRILAALDETGQADNTLVVFTSDHGDMMGSHRMVGKGYMFEESTRVPLLLRLPGQRTQRRVTMAVSQTDVVPTLLDILGKAVPSHLEGRSLRPAAEGRAQRPENVFIEWHGDHRAAKPPKPLPDYLQGLCTAERAEEVQAESIRTVVSPEGRKVNISTAGEHEVFDLRHDWQERQNLFRDHRGMANEALARIRAWQQRTGDRLELPDKV